MWIVGIFEAIRFTNDSSTIEFCLFFHIHSFIPCLFVCLFSPLPWFPHFPISLVHSLTPLSFHQHTPRKRSSRSLGSHFSHRIHVFFPSLPFIPQRTSFPSFRSGVSFSRCLRSTSLNRSSKGVCHRRIHRSECQ